MRSSGKSRIAQVLKNSLTAIFALVFGVVLFSHTASATSTIVQVGLSGSPASDIQLVGVTSPLTVTDMPLVINGTTTNLTQVQVYVDGFYSATIPLTPSTTTFSYSLNLNSGSHTVQFLGISASGGTNPSVTITVVYTPSVMPPTGGGGSSGSGTTTPNASGVTIGGQLVPQVGGQNQLIVPIPGWFYSALVFFDILNPNSPGDMSVMVWRFLLILLGLFLVVFARPTLAFYRWLRYRVLYWNKHPLGRVLRDHPLFWIRLVGSIVIILVFILL